MEGAPKIRREKEGFWHTRKKELMAFAALVAAGGIGAVEFSNQKAPSYDSDWEGIRQETPFDLQPLEHIARAKVEVAGSKYLIHVGQMHGASSLEFTKNYYEAQGVPIERLVECQKQIEQTLTYLSDRYNVRSVYMEKVLSEDAAFYHKERESLMEQPQENGRELYEESKSNPSTSLPVQLEEYGARNLIYVAEALKGSAVGLAASGDPLIAGDLKYVWGAPYILAAQGKIDLKAAEDAYANSAAQQKGITSAEGHRIRQDAALALIEKGERGRQESVALVYGAAHDFTQNVETSNSEDSQEERFGLIRIDPNACH